MTGDKALPAGFASLEPFVARWSLSSVAERRAARIAADDAERRRFYDVAQPLLSDALKRLDERPASMLTAAERRLMRLMLSLAHVALAVEVQGPSEDAQSIGRRRMILTRSLSETETADLA